MNGKKAKMLRKLAGVSKDNCQNRSYHGIESTVRVKEVTHPHLTGTDGKPLVIARHRTATYALNQGARLLNKVLKKNYLTALRNPNTRMLAA